MTPDTDRDEQRKTYAHDPHLPPSLVWAGKAEGTSFEVQTVSLHVHERIDPRTILEAVARRDVPVQPSLFEAATENPPLHEAIEFYKHPRGWSNRLIAGDSLLVMNSLLEKEGMAGQVQTIYVDPPYGIRYGSNFQPFVQQRSVRDGDDDDLTREPEMVRAFRDTWELGIHSYLTYLRDRLLLARELLGETGSCFVQIGEENLHLVRNVLDDVFGPTNFVVVVAFTKSGGLEAAARVASRLDYLLWYARDKTQLKYHQLYTARTNPFTSGYSMLELPDGTRRAATTEERAGIVPLPRGTRLFRSDSLTKPGPGAKYEFEYEGQVFTSGRRWWGMPKESLQVLAQKRRLMVSGNSLRYVRYHDDFPMKPLDNLWDGLYGAANPVYVVQTSVEVVQRCLLMTTDPGELVFDPTCGSGTTAFVAEMWGRRWITCDTSRVALTLAKQRLMTSVYNYYELAHPEEGVASGFRYRSLPHVMPSTIANAEPPKVETLYDQPLVDSSRARVPGPFTLEAVPAPAVRPVDEPASQPADDATIARAGPTLRHAEWRDRLLRSGIRGRGGRLVEFARVEPLGGTRYLHATAETKEKTPQLAAVSFGPEYAPLEQRQVELAWDEARTLRARPVLLIFAAFQFDPEAAKDIDAMDPERAGMTFLRAQMDADLLVGDLKKRPGGDQSFWLIGQPDVQLRTVKAGVGASEYRVELAGFDYYDPRTGTIESGDTSKIALWLLDPDYDGRSLFPRQVFFPLASEKDGWSRLGRELRAQLDESLLEAYHGTVSLPFAAGKHKRAAVKIVDDRGIESLKILELD
ncbi:MAG: site-specific DNA-methyltransferase [Candidatus Limnocylindria bacterium]